MTGQGQRKLAAIKIITSQSHHNRKKKKVEEKNAVLFQNNQESKENKQKMFLFQAPKYIKPDPTKGGTVRNDISQKAIKET